MNINSYRAKVAQYGAALRYALRCKVAAALRQKYAEEDGSNSKGSSKALRNALLGAGVGTVGGAGVGALVQALRGKSILPGLGIGAGVGALGGAGLGYGLTSRDLPVNSAPAVTPSYDVVNATAPNDYVSFGSDNKRLDDPSLVDNMYGGAVGRVLGVAERNARDARIRTAKLPKEVRIKPYNIFNSADAAAAKWFNQGAGKPGSDTADLIAQLKAIQAIQAAQAAPAEPAAPNASGAAPTSGAALLKATLNAPGGVGIDTRPNFNLNLGTVDDSALKDNYLSTFGVPPVSRYAL